MKKTIIVFGLLLMAYAGFAQDEEEDRRFFKKENLFTGGSLSLSFFNNSFLIGVNPHLGYSLTRWADVGLVINYNYTSFRDYNYLNDKLRQTVYGGGVFTRLFPVRFLFAQAQIEHNWIKLKYFPPPNSGIVGETNSISGNSILVGGGYTTGRDPSGKSVYGYFAILFDVSKSATSPVYR